MSGFLIGTSILGASVLGAIASDADATREASERRRFLARLPLVRLVENGIEFRPCMPVEFPTLRNTEKAPWLGAFAQQDIEPAGRYVLHDLDPRVPLVRGWVRGVERFSCPLVLSFNATGHLTYDESSWKRVLYDVVQKSGENLSRHLLHMGFDGIVTVLDGETKEIVSLLPVVTRR